MACTAAWRSLALLDKKPKNTNCPSPPQPLALKTVVTLLAPGTGITRNPAAWHGDDITDETKKDWRDFLAAHNLEAAVSARGVCMSTKWGSLSGKNRFAAPLHAQ
jgi:hypothetical protein